MDRSQGSAEPLRQHAGLRMVRELAAVVLVCTKAVEGIVDVLSHQRVQAAPAASSWGYRSSYRDDEDDR